MTSNHELVGRALGLLHQGLYPFVEREMRSVYGDRWIVEATPYVPKDRNRKRNIEQTLQQDISALLKVMIGRWAVVFKKTLGQAERSLVSELLESRNDWAHHEPFSTEKAYRALDSVTLLLKAIGAKEADILEKPKKELLQKLLPETEVNGEIKDTDPDCKMRTIAIHAAKGGVGKTTLVVNLAYELAKKGKRVLVIDLDDSANTSLLLGVNKAEQIEKADNLEEIERILHSFDGRKELIDFLIECRDSQFDGKNYIYPTSFNGYLRNEGKLDIIPSSHRTIAKDLLTVTWPQKRLEWGLQNVASQYDFAIIDTPPSRDAISENGLYAAQYWLIPSQMEYLSLYGIFEPIRRARLVQERTNQASGNILGIVPMMTEPRLNLNKRITELVRDTFSDIKVFADVKRSTHVGMALSARQPVSVYSRNNRQVPSDIGNMFSEITDELLMQIETIENNKSR
jgi:chromosome partitioning protein